MTRRALPKLCAVTMALKCPRECETPMQLNTLHAKICRTLPNNNQKSQNFLIAVSRLQINQRLSLLLLRISYVSLKLPWGFPETFEKNSKNYAGVGSALPLLSSCFCPHLNTALLTRSSAPLSPGKLPRSFLEASRSRLKAF